MIVTPSAPDRDGDRVITRGGQLESYLKNPVLLWAHDHKGIPIGTVTALDRADGSLRPTWRGSCAQYLGAQRSNKCGRRFRTVVQRRLSIPAPPCCRTAR
jgi:hypothetical protein